MLPHPVLAALFAMLVAGTASTVRADEAVVDKPLSIADAKREFRAKGFELLVGNARIRGAEGDRRAAGALANPVLTPVVGRAFGYSPANCDGCSATTLGISIGDPSALSDLAMRKRALRTRVADHVVLAAKLGRRRAEQQLLSDVKTQYVVLAGAERILAFTRVVQTSLEETARLYRVKYPATIDEGQLARVEREALEGENATDLAVASVRDAQATLAYLLGARDGVPAYVTVGDPLAFRPPTMLADATASSLARRAFLSRPDLQQADDEIIRTQDAVALAKRQVAPDVGWTLAYTQTGTGNAAIQPPTLTLAVQVPLPILYRRQGEITRANADHDVSLIERERARAQAASDIASAFADLSANRRVVERTEATVLERARKARDITEIQFRAGSATLVDYLDAQRAFVQTNVAYVNALIAYWSAIYRLEAAVGDELSQ